MATSRTAAQRTRRDPVLAALFKKAGRSYEEGVDDLLSKLEVSYALLWAQQEGATSHQGLG